MLDTITKMASNAWNNPMEFISYGLSQSGKAITNELPSVPSLPTLKNPLDRKTPEETYQPGDVNAHGLIRDSFTPSRSTKAPRQHAFNLVPAGEKNIHGGSFDFSA